MAAHEAAVRCGRPERAARALERLSETTSTSGTEWRLGVEAGLRALLSEGEAADALHQEALARLGRAGAPLAVARAHLLYGEWLCQQRRRPSAREQLHIAHEMFATIGMEAFAARAARGLLAAGETVRKRAAATARQLTTQESQIARLAADGLSNPEIGARLFISPRTVEYHLHKVFTKLDIHSRGQLNAALRSEPHAAQPA